MQQGLALDDVVQRVSPADAEALAAATAGERVRLWGATPPKRSGDEKATALRERRVGDRVLFYADSTFIAAARILYLLHSPELARWVWGEDDGGQTWEHIMALTDVEYRTLPAPQILPQVGRAPVLRNMALLFPIDSDTVWRAWEAAPAAAEPARRTMRRSSPSVTEALAVLRALIGQPLITATGATNRIMSVQDQSALVATARTPSGSAVPAREVQHGLDLLRAHGEVRVQVPVLGHRSSFIGAVLGALPGARLLTDPARVMLDEELTLAVTRVPIMASLDGTAQATVRREQAPLRRRLLKGASTGLCALCGAQLPTDLLIAAHIKPRSECSDAEKADLDNIAMLACLFGCDALYENGYISVDATGRIVAADVVDVTTAHLRDRLERLGGQMCSAHRPATATYFLWHWERRLLRTEVNNT
ncbi:hypothetical protein FHR75_001277 [Kineococcus radiotolerans]|uniref:HNH nuclease domain-containing protein n=1 Tax=Kineococcus radiotolerans TaxID=131568 RepID=A0A7W4TKB2_KINRA|nr:HNH endonuclease signature motif containing protein [Kineococcus radiotolerans]MBB2900489.1 hypothetical protein [Kineococcus radiotolerans]